MLPYLQGVCAEIDGDYDTALELYSTADKRATTPVKEIGEAMTRVKDAKQKSEKLDKQLKVSEPASGDGAPASARAGQGDPPGQGRQEKSKKAKTNTDN